MKRAWLGLGIAAVLALPAYAQDAVKADPSHYKTVAENERVRVLKAHVPAGDKGVMHEHPDNVVVFLTATNVRFGLPDGTTTPESKRAAGDVMVGTAGKHKPENLGGVVEGFVIELKPGTGKVVAAATTAGLPPLLPKMTRTPITSSDKAEAVRVKIEAGFEEPAGSAHPQDLVVIPISEGSGVTLTMDGKTVEMKRGQAYLIPRGKPHGVKAAAASESVVVYVK